MLLLYTGDNPLTEVDFTAGKIKKKLSNLKPSSAPGPDRVWATVLHNPLFGPNNAHQIAEAVHLHLGVTGGLVGQGHGVT